MDGFVGVFIAVVFVVGVFIGIGWAVGCLLVRLLIEVCVGLVMLFMVCGWGCLVMFAVGAAVIWAVIGWVLIFFVVLKFCWIVWLNIAVWLFSGNSRVILLVEVGLNVFMLINCVGSIFAFGLFG